MTHFIENSTLSDLVKEDCLCPPPEPPEFGCTTTSLQYADISVPIEIKPNVTIGKIDTQCCGAPVVCCKDNNTNNTCEINITQTVCIKIPINYNIMACIGEEKIDCSCDKDCCNNS